MAHRVTSAFFLPILALAIVSLMGCSAHVGFQPTTGATVNQNNFRVVDSVSGHATHTKILGFGSAGNLLERARLDAIEEAGIRGSSRAIINWTSDYEYTFYGYALTKSVTLSGEVIKFSD